MFLGTEVKIIKPVTFAVAPQEGTGFSISEAARQIRSFYSI